MAAPPGDLAANGVGEDLHARCVVLTVPSYTAETPIRAEALEASVHTEKVDRASKTDFAVSMHHRFESSPLASEIIAELTTGDKSLDPKTLHSGAGTLTYVAPDEDGKDATVKLTSTSNRGIGTLVLTFHTETLKLQVTINGTQNVADFLPSTLTMSPIMLTKRADGSFGGAGASNMVGTLGPCSPAMIETGTIALTATQEPSPDGTTPGKWTVVWEAPTGAPNVTFNCEGETLAAVLIAPHGYASVFVQDLGPMTVPADGGTVTIHKAGSLGALDATVVVEVLTGDG
jgi:hypothetical protein